MGGGTRTSAPCLSNQQHTPASKPRARPTATPAKATSAMIGSRPQIPIDLTEKDEPAPCKKRKVDPQWPAGSQASSKAPRPSPRKKKRDAARPKEKRLRRFRPNPPQSFFDVHDRAISQRFFVLERRRTGTDECPGEVAELTGSTGNVYTVTIGLKPDCDCPHAQNGNQCKHVIFVSSTKAWHS